MIAELCKGVHCVDLGESFQTHIFLQHLASIQPRTSPVKLARWSNAAAHVVQEAGGDGGHVELKAREDERHARELLLRGDTHASCLCAFSQ